MAQRILTANKYEQRIALSGFLAKLNLPPKGRGVLDFGCGTALFAGMFKKLGMQYAGYDIDPRLIGFARRLYPWARFSSGKEDVRQWAPFDLVLMNCCTHHIPDEVLAQELDEMGNWLAPQGICLLVDILKVESSRESRLHKWFMALEQGRHIRTRAEYLARMSEGFTITAVTSWRSSTFSFTHRLNPFYNDLIVIAGRRNEKA